MLHEVRGDILLTHAQAVAHGVAPNDDFHQGLALALRERWPQMYKAFRQHCRTRHPKPGRVWEWDGPDGRRLFTLLTQEAAYGRGEKPGRASIQHVNHCLKELRKLIDEEHVHSLAIPAIATGVGGLSWEDVQPLLRTHLADADCEVFVYKTYEAGVQAEEVGIDSPES